MNKYIYSECTSDAFPNLFSIMGKSYNDAVEKLIRKYIDKFDDDNNITKIEELEDLQYYLNDNYDLVISDLTDIDDL